MNEIERIVIMGGGPGGIAAAAGQLGLGRQGAEAILAFSESVARASTTLSHITTLGLREVFTRFESFREPFGPLCRLLRGPCRRRPWTPDNITEVVAFLAEGVRAVSHEPGLSRTGKVRKVGLV